MDQEKDVSIEKLSRDTVYRDRSVYRKNISVAGKYSCRLRYKYTDIFITSDRDISEKISKPVTDFYKQLEEVISGDKGFGESLCPVNIDRSYPPFIKKMCRSAALFNVGPMAAVAGAVCDCIASDVKDDCSFLMIENGGDVYIKSNSQVNASLFTGSRHFPENINISISSRATPCGLCSSSGVMGHSLSLGKSDLVTVLADTTIMADAAATVIANSISSRLDVDRAIEKYRNYRHVRGLVIIKDDRFAIWGDLQLA